MTSTTKAVVETLTAEVRVLMVGSRQITLSVYRQLDHKPPEDIEIFGRVRSDKGLDGIELVGRAADGSLVRSYVSAPLVWYDEEDVPADLRAKIEDRYQHYLDLQARVAKLPLIVLAGLR
jgi:hypothetical protein